MSRDGPVSPRVDVKVAEDDGVEGVRLGRPLQHRLEPGHVGRQPHARERPDRLVGEVQRVAGRSADYVGNKLEIEFTKN